MNLVVAAIERQRLMVPIAPPFATLLLTCELGRTEKRRGIRHLLAPRRESAADRALAPRSLHRPRDEDHS